MGEGRGLVALEHVQLNQPLEGDGFDQSYGFQVVEAAGDFVVGPRGKPRRNGVEVRRIAYALQDGPMRLGQA